MKNTYKKQIGGNNLFMKFYDYNSEQIPVSIRDQLIEAQKYCFPELSALSDSDIFNLLYNPYTDLWIITDKDNNEAYVASASINYNREIKNLIGFPPMTKDSLINPDSLYNLIWNVCVSDKYRNKGICNILIRNIIQTVYPNILPFALNVLKTNSPAKKCYLKNGFKKIDGCTDPDNNIMVTDVKNISLPAAFAPPAFAPPAFVPAAFAPPAFVPAAFAPPAFVSPAFVPPAFAAPVHEMPAGATLLQTLWKPQLAKKCQFSMEIPREIAKDCTISSLAGLDFLNLDDAEELSRRIHTFNKMPTDKLLTEFLSNALNIDVGIGTFNILSASERNGYIDQINNFLLANLKPLNATLLAYSYIKNGILLGHAVIIRRTIFNTIIVNDLQQGFEKLFKDFFIDDPRIIEIAIFSIRENPNRMHIDTDLDKLVPKRGGKKYKTKKSKMVKKKSRKSKKSKKV